MSINFNYKFSKYSYQPHNPHIGAEGCIRWICESYHAVFDHLEKRPAKSLLEIGCGFGTSTWIMKDAVDGKTVGLDISKEAITSAKKLFPGIKYICQNYKEYFKKNFDINVESFSYPYGKYNKKIIKFVEKYYKFAVTTKRSRFKFNKFDLLEIPRVPINSNTNIFKFYLKVKTFYEDLNFKT